MSRRAVLLLVLGTAIASGLIGAWIVLAVRPTSATAAAEAPRRPRGGDVAGEERWRVCRASYDTRSNRHYSPIREQVRANVAATERAENLAIQVAEELGVDLGPSALEWKEEFEGEPSFDVIEPSDWLDGCMRGLWGPFKR